MHETTFKDLWALPVNDIIAKVAPNDLAIHFQDKENNILVSLKHCELAQHAQ